MINTKNYEKEIKRIGVDKLPPVLHEAHEWFSQAKDYYKENKTIKATADIYFKKLEELELTSSTPTAKGKKHCSKDVEIIEVFISFHSKAVDRKKVLDLIHSIHSAISKKEISASSSFAAEIRLIQNRLVHIYNNSASVQIKIVIDEKNLKRFKEIILKKKS